LRLTVLSGVFPKLLTDPSTIFSTQEFNVISSFSFKRHLIASVLALGLGACVTAPALAQSEASLMLSTLPLASVVGVTGSAVAGAATVSAVPVALAVSGAVLTVKAVEVSARGTVYVLERASDGARASVELSGRAALGVAASVGAAVTVSVIGTGILLSLAGEVLCFIPNALGKALLHNERVTH
jgi:hypothetical protein